MNIWPPLDNSLYIASLIIALFSFKTYVCTGYLLTGGVSINDKLLSPVIDIWSVRGIGVADNVKTSILFLYDLIFSLCLTPNLCSSSITNNPKSLKTISSDKMRCVPITISISPFLIFSILAFIIFFETNLLIKQILTSKFLNLSTAFL